MKNKRHTYKCSTSIKFAIAAVAALIAGQFSASSSSAALVSISAPASVVPGALTSASDVYIFFESTQELADPLNVDIITPGLYNLANPDDPGVIPADTKVASYMIHHDSVGFLPNTAAVTYVFPQKVLGLIINDRNLDTSDPIVGNPGTTYPTGLAYRGLEVPYTFLNDVVFWNGNQVTVTGKSTTALVIDQIRVITAVPEPSTFVLAAMALPIVWLIRQRRSRTK